VSFCKTNLAGCRAFAISETEALFSGQYKDAPESVYLGKLSPTELRDARQLRLLTPDGSACDQSQLLARGKSLYYFDAEKVCRFSLD